MSTLEEFVDSLEWENTDYSLKDIAENFDNPIVVRLKANEGSEIPHLGEHVDVHKPFLVFSRRRRTRAYAENLVWNDKKRLYVPDGDLLEVPKDYLGWFEVLPADGKVSVAKHCSSIQEISLAGASFFLVTTPAAGFCGRLADDNNLVLEAEIQVYPGEILKVHGVISKTWVLLGKKEQENNNSSPQTHLLHCSDRRKRDLYIPLAHPGKFCVIAEDGSKDANSVSQIGSLTDRKLPLLVRLVWGWAPQNSCPTFSGLMRIIGMRRFDSIVLHSIQDGKSLIVEVPVDMDISIQKAKHISAYSETRAYIDMLDRCCRQVYSFLTSMKSLSGRYHRVVDTADTQQQQQLQHQQQQQQQRFGRMTEAMDMNSFNASKIFPVKETEKVSETWSLSFRDPEYLYDDAGNIIDENALWVDLSEGQSMPVTSKKNVSRNDKGSISGYIGDSFTVLPQNFTPGGQRLPRVQHVTDYRSVHDKDMKNREARC